MSIWIIKCKTDGSIFQTWNITGTMPRFTDVSHTTSIAVHSTLELAEANVANIEDECNHFKGKLVAVEVKL